MTSVTDISTQQLVELFTISTNPPPTKRTITCSVCKCAGHTKRNCKNIFESDNVVSVAAIPATAIPAAAIPAAAIPATAIPAAAIPATAIPATAIPAPSNKTNKKTSTTGTGATTTGTDPIKKPKMKSIAIQVKPPKEKKQPKVVEQCPICYKNLHDNKNIVITKCGHKFCSKCIFDYLKSNDNGNKCPMCRVTYAPSMETKPKFTDRQVINAVKSELDDINFVNNSNLQTVRTDTFINPNSRRRYHINSRTDEFRSALQETPYEFRHANFMKLYDILQSKFMPQNHTTWEKSKEFECVINLLFDTINDSVYSFSNNIGITET